MQTKTLRKNVHCFNKDASVNRPHASTVKYECRNQW